MRLLQNDIHNLSESSMILYRIVRNDLPPRHSYNHIEQRLINLLNQYNQFYWRIPFNWNEYRQIPLDYPSDDYFNSKKFDRLNSSDKLGLINAFYHQKNLYVMNNNGARNFALRHGKQETRAHWFMIFDGNCFLTQQGFDEVRQSILINGSRIKKIVETARQTINIKSGYFNTRHKTV